MTQPPAASAPYQILFAFTAATGAVLEIKRLGLPADAPRSRKYQWLWIAAGNGPRQALPLQFVSMSQGDCQERVFAEGTLRFGERDAAMTLPTGQTLHLRACAADAVPPDVAALVARFVAAD
ncbi:hypothetical protein [Cupriavidus basilensis]|uniref:hypothetical protein n=1 Tax=Cupriavidus basilensis TaxID=68895 RepID=UPI0020A6BBF9|nr:hypothetical protein [Cupriavidus basilensis]MCP3020200.1 hypothetical protein [Cupriavidus basilensis]MDR3380274.1 hypothetical protein [Cupriavidus basilensis]